MKHETELLLLPDGRILIHNLTPAMAALLSDIAPNDLAMQRRAAASVRCLRQPITRPHPLAGSADESTHT